MSPCDVRIERLAPCQARDVERKGRGRLRLQRRRVHATAGARLRLHPVVAAGGGPAPVADIAVQHRRHIGGARFAFAPQRLGLIDVAMDQHVRPERREGIVGVQGQADARQSQIAFAVQVLQIDADRRAHLLVQVALQRARQLDLLALQLAEVEGVDVVRDEQLAVLADLRVAVRVVREVLAHPGLRRLVDRLSVPPRTLWRARRPRIDLGAEGRGGVRGDHQVAVAVARDAELVGDPVGQAGTLQNIG